MKQYKHLVINGCSFAAGAMLDNTNKERYGRLISNKMNLEEINLALHGGSNDRIFRTSYDWIQRNKKNCKNTLMIIGLTETFREELYSVKTKKYTKFQYANLDTKQDIDDFKDISGIKDYNKVKQYLEYRFLNFVDELYFKENLRRNIVLLHNYAKSNNIDVVFFDALKDDGNFEEQHRYEYDYSSNQYQDNIKFIVDNDLNYFIFPNNAKNWKKHMLNLDDTYKGYHPTKKQHQEFSELLWEYLNETF